MIKCIAISTMVIYLCEIVVFNSLNIVYAALGYFLLTIALGILINSYKLKKRELFLRIVIISFLVANLNSIFLILSSVNIKIKFLSTFDGRNFLVDFLREFSMNTVLLLIGAGGRSLFRVGKRCFYKNKQNSV